MRNAARRRIVLRAAFTAAAKFLPFWAEILLTRFGEFDNILFTYGRLAQLVRASGLHPECRGFDPLIVQKGRAALLQRMRRFFCAGINFDIFNRPAKKLRPRGLAKYRRAPMRLCKTQSAVLRITRLTLETALAARSLARRKSPRGCRLRL